MTKTAIFSAFLLVQGFLFSQVQVLDSLTLEPVAYAHVKIIHQNKGRIANHEGVLELDSLFNDIDSVRISCTGYEPKLVSVEALRAATSIALMPKHQQLDEVQVVSRKGKFRHLKLGVTKKPHTRFFDPSVAGDNGMIRAVYIPNEQSVSGVLKSVNLFISEHGFPDAHFRLHIYAVSSLAIRPDKELTSANIVVSGTSGNEWLNIDLENERIVIPENGCFVGVEWFDSPKSQPFLDSIKVDAVAMVDGKLTDTSFIHIRKGNGMVLGSVSQTYKETKNKLWYKKYLSDDWVNWCTSTADESEFYIPDTLPTGHIVRLNENNIFYKVPCIHVTVSFPKEKISVDYEPPKKRKLNRLERVKENSFEYPQSSVEELFYSLVKAVERNDIIYILKYLCVYGEDELTDIIATIEQNEEAHGAYLTEADKTRMIDHLTAIIDGLNEQSLTKVDNHHFQLMTGNEQYNLIVEDGKWKINPYSHRIMR